MPYGHSAEHREMVLEQLQAGRLFRDVAASLEVGDLTVFRWKAQNRFDRGVRPGRTTVEAASLKAVHTQIKEHEAELAATKRASERVVR